MYVPPQDQGWVDMGTPLVFRNVIFFLNQRHADRNENIVFPGASLVSTSARTIALPNSSAGFSLHGAIIPEGKFIESADDVLLIVETSSQYYRKCNGYSQMEKACKEENLYPSKNGVS